MLTFLRKYIVTFVVLVFAVIILAICLLNQRIIYAFDMMQLLSPICAKGAQREFQVEENMDNYLINDLPSPAYIEYLNWLNSYQTFYNVVYDLRNNYNLGVNPTNYALPYIDAELLEQYFNESLNNQITAFNQSTGGIAPITDCTGEVVNVSREMKRFSLTNEIWGLSSDFASNTLNHNKLYDYDYYVSYMITYRVTLELTGYLAFFGGLSGSDSITYEFSIPYELVN